MPASVFDVGGFDLSTAPPEHRPERTANATNAAMTANTTAPLTAPPQTAGSSPPRAGRESCKAPGPVPLLLEGVAEALVQHIGVGTTTCPAVADIELLTLDEPP